MIYSYYIRPKISFGDDIFDEFIDTFTFNPNLKSYNPEEYDLVPKKGIIEKKIGKKEEEIKKVEKQKQLEMEGWDLRIKNLQTDIEELKKKL